MRRVLFAITATCIFGGFASAAPKAQVINCDRPQWVDEKLCLDNWGIDLIGADKSELESGIFYRNRKYYWDNGGHGVNVYVMDTGIERTNVDFTNRVGTGLSATATPEDCHAASHGTMVAGIIGGSRFGVAKNVTIQPVKVTNSSCAFTITNWETMLQAVIDRVKALPDNRAIVNISSNLPAGEYSQKMTDLVKELVNVHQVSVVASAGNKNRYAGALDFWPSNISEVIVVGGIDKDGRRWIRSATEPEAYLCNQFGDCGSNYGPGIDIWAPARDIRSATRSIGHGNSIPRIRSGTSFAAPHVTGVIALYLQSNPSATPWNVWNHLLGNAANLGDLDGDFSADYMVRAVPPTNLQCVMPTYQYTTKNVATRIHTSDIEDTCSSTEDALVNNDAKLGTIKAVAFGATATVYEYSPNLNATGWDWFTASIYEPWPTEKFKQRIDLNIQPYN